MAPLPQRLSRPARGARVGGRFKRPERGRPGARGRGDPAAPGAQTRSLRWPEPAAPAGAAFPEREK